MKNKNELYKGFDRDEYNINGVKTVVYSAGRGQPVVYFHGGGTFHGIDFAHDWTDRFRVICPFHPGFGESGDATSIHSFNDYLLHYLDLFDRLGLKEFDLVGISLGGWLAAEFAVAHGQRLRKLVLLAPAGLNDPEHPPLDFSAVPPEEVLNYLVNDFEVLKPHLPENDQEAEAFAADRMREGQMFGRVAPQGPQNPGLEHWLHRVTIPTLLIWGTEDKVLPAGKADKWMRLLPDARLELLDGIGHLILDESAAARKMIGDFVSGQW